LTRSIWAHSLLAFYQPISHNPKKELKDVWVMHIVHITSECAPVAKVGGLGDVIYGLGKETAKHHDKVEIILPKYDIIDYHKLEHLAVEKREIWVQEGQQRYNNTIWSAEIEKLRLKLIEPHHPSYYFSRGMIYGCHDDIDRFTYFCRAALEYLLKSGKEPDIIHIHDWPTALVAPLVKELFASLDVRIVLTIHNLEHQGKCSPLNLSRLGLKGESFLHPDKMQDPHAPGTINLMKGAIEYADFITTVSPTYEKEIKTVEGGCGLHTTLLKHESKLKGILNGIDEHFWDPKKDPHLVKGYDTHQVKKIAPVLEAKVENRKQLTSLLGLEKSNAPLVCSITRLVPQKGPQLIKHALLKTLEQGGQFVLLGSPQNSDIEREFRQLQKELAKNKNVALFLDKDEALAHLLYASSDLFIVPSIFEPCGLTQMIALRYGAIPLVRSTGGLADTVFDIDTSSKPQNERNGFTFDFPDNAGVDWALNRALELFKDKPKWQALMKQAMHYDFSWHQVAQDYFQIYRDLTSHSKIAVALL
jgi:starch synthase